MYYFRAALVRILYLVTGDLEGKNRENRAFLQDARKISLIILLLIISVFEKVNLTQYNINAIIIKTYCEFYSAIDCSENCSYLFFLHSFAIRKRFDVETFCIWETLNLSPNSI